MSLKFLDYVGKTAGRQGQAFKPWMTRGFAVIEVLPMLQGHEWNDIALAYVHALRPTQLRVVDEGIQLDCQTWRVTVYLEHGSKIIKRIVQEVEVGLPDDCPHSVALADLLFANVTS